MERSGLFPSPLTYSFTIVITDKNIDENDFNFVNAKVDLELLVLLMIVQFWHMLNCCDN